MIITTVFIYIIVLHLFIFHLVSFPLLAIQSEYQQARLDAENAEKAKKNTLIALCNVTGVDCGSCKNVTEDGGMIESAHLRDRYDSNCLFTISAPGDKKIQLSFTELTVDKCCDFITVFDERANLIELNLNESDVPSNLISPSNRITINFTSNIDNMTRRDQPGPAPRWQAVYTFM